MRKASGTYSLAIGEVELASYECARATDETGSIELASTFLYDRSTGDILDDDVE